MMETALREAHEEIGVDPLKVEILGLMTELYVWASNATVAPVLAYVKVRPEFVANASEVSEVIEIDIEHLLDKNNVKSKTLKLSEGIEVEAPYYDIGHKMIWGATAMMLSELKEVVFQMENNESK
jgi:8-oxo-dGTP pyrophosphatase MutT (NUDIX family)